MNSTIASVPIQRVLSSPEKGSYAGQVPHKAAAGNSPANPKAEPSLFKGREQDATAREMFIGKCRERSGNGLGRWMNDTRDARPIRDCSDDEDGLLWLEPEPTEKAQCPLKDSVWKLS